MHCGAGFLADVQDVVHVRTHVLGRVFITAAEGDGERVDHDQDDFTALAFEDLGRLHDALHGVPDRGRVGRQLPLHASRLAVDIRDAERLAAVEVTIERGARAARRLRHVAHADTSHAVLHEEARRHVEDAFGDELVVVADEGAAGHHASPCAANGSVS